MVPLLIGIAFLVLILLSAAWNKDGLKRYQELKNKKRFSGRKLSPQEQAEMDKLMVKYWWY